MAKKRRRTTVRGCVLPRPLVEAKRLVRVFFNLDQQFIRKQPRALPAAGRVTVMLPRGSATRVLHVQLAMQCLSTDPRLATGSGANFSSLPDCRVVAHLHQHLAEIV